MKLNINNTTYEAKFVRNSGKNEIWGIYTGRGRFIDTIKIPANATMDDWKTAILACIDADKKSSK